MHCIISDRRAHMSEIERFRRQQKKEEEAARLGLSGTAVVGGHDAVIARMEPGANRLLELFRRGQDQEAWNLWEAGILEGDVS